MDKNLVIGLGSGRCGTVSLRDLLNHQGFNAVHELKLMPWFPDYEICNAVIKDILIRKSDLVADIGYYYLPYVLYIAIKYPTTKFVCLQRDKEEVINSFLKFSKYNYWSYPYIDREKTEWDSTFPTYHNLSKAEAISQYWGDYYKTVRSLVKIIPDNIQLFDMNKTFNEEDGQRKLFEFIGIESKIKLGINRHANPPDRPMKYV